MRGVLSFYNSQTQGEGYPGSGQGRRFYERKTAMTVVNGLSGPEEDNDIRDSDSNPVVCSPKYHVWEEKKEYV